MELKVPPLGESITEVEVVEWLKKEGSAVAKDEPVVVVESEKATVEVPAPAAGTLAKVLKAAGQTAKVGEVLGEIAEGEAKAEPKKAAEPEPEREARPKPEKASEPEPRREPEPEAERPPTPSERRERRQGAEEVQRMSALRRSMARRLVEAQNASVWLSTFNEVDCGEIARLRATAGPAFREKHGVKLGLMPFFVRAAVEALKRFPQLNAEVRGEDMAFKKRYDIGIAVSTERGLVVPVLRGADALGVPGIEKAVARLAERARDRRLEPAELEGGTFTITNGGVFGSLLSTPVVNPPQTGVLGMHAIVDRPVAREGQVVIRPMMYLALTYDHRAADGREAVSFLKSVKDALEEPARLLLDL